MADKKKLIEILRGKLEEKQKAKAQADTEVVRQGFSDKVFETVSGELGSLLKPVIEEMQKNSSLSAQELKRIIAESVQIEAPALDSEGIKQAIYEAVREIQVASPEITLPEIRVPKIEIPEIKIPDVIMPDRMMAMLEYDSKKPLPVILMGADGKPFQFAIGGGSGGGKSNFFRLAYTSDDPLPVSASLDLSDTLTVNQLSGANWSVYVTGNFGSTFSGSDILNADNRLRVSVETGGSGLTDTELRASALDVKQVSGSVDSVIVNAGTLTGITNSLEVKQVSGFADSVFITGSSGTTAVVGDVVSDAADTDSAPVKFGGIARTANPSAVSGGDRVAASFDTLGRQVMRPIQVRGLVQTAYATLSTNTETTLLGTSAGSFHDLIWVKFANTSSGAVTIDLRDSTAGSIVDTWEVPANSVTGVSMPVPYPQGNVGNNWTVDYNDSDLSNTTVYVSALFTREV